VVPNVIGKTVAAARTRIGKAHCKVGTITRVTSTKKKAGKVLAEKPKAGTKLRNGGKVNLTVGKGPKKKK
jgi:eukaryotic-like serine/threonine-protein kinase